MKTVVTLVSVVVPTVLRTSSADRLREMCGEKCLVGLLGNFFRLILHRRVTGILFRVGSRCNSCLPETVDARWTGGVEGVEVRSVTLDHRTGVYGDSKRV